MGRKESNQTNKTCNSLFLSLTKAILAAKCDFQQCGILTSVDSDERAQPPFKLRKTHNNVRSVAEVSLNIQAASKDCDQTAHMRRLV